MIEDFFYLPPVSMTPVVHLDLRISLRIFEKIRNGPNSILRGLGETDTWKNPEVKNLVTLSLSSPSLRVGIHVKYALSAVRAQKRLVKFKRGDIKNAESDF